MSGNPSKRCKVDTDTKMEEDLWDDIDDDILVEMSQMAAVEPEQVFPEDDHFNDLDSSMFFNTDGADSWIEEPANETAINADRFNQTQTQFTFHQEKKKPAAVVPSSNFKFPVSSRPSAAEKNEINSLKAKVDALNTELYAKRVFFYLYYLMIIIAYLNREK